MNRVVSSLAGAVLAVAPLTAQLDATGCGLGVGVPPAGRVVQFTLVGPQQGFWGAVFVSLEAAPISFPLQLQSYVLVGVGYAPQGSYELTLPLVDAPVGLQVQIQGLTYHTGENGVGTLCATEVKPFVVGAGGEG